MKLPFVVAFSLLFSYLAVGQNNPPVISNVTCLADTQDNRLIVEYDLTDVEGDDVDVIFRVSSDSGFSYVFDQGWTTGDVGYPVTPGSNKTLVWHYDSVGDITQYKVKLVADDRVPIDIQEIVDQVDSTNLWNDLTWIAQERHNTSAPTHWIAVRDSLYDRFEADGLIAWRFPFVYQNVNAENQIGRIPGCKNEGISYVIDSHFDGVTNSPGADDNGAGVAGLLEASRILSQYNFERSINIIGFDLEEQGLVGSARYVNDGGIFPWETVDGVLNFEMIGYYSEQDSTQEFPPGFASLFPDVQDSVMAQNYKGNFLTNVANTNSSWLRQTFDSCALVYVPELRVLSLEAPGTGFLTPDLRRSDHARFWDAGIAALMLTDGAEYRNFNYHTPFDTVGALDVNFMTNNVKAALATIATLARPQHSTVSVHDIFVHPASGIAQVAEKRFEFTLYPNPSEGEVVLALQQEVQGELTVKIVDHQGKEVFQLTAANAIDGSIELDISHLARGTYFVQLFAKGYVGVQQVILK